MFEMKEFLYLFENSFYLNLQTLNIVAEFPERFRVVGLAAGSNVTLLAEQVTISQLPYSKHVINLIT